MKPQDLKSFVQRSPFRAFSVRLSNGAVYDFKKREDLGATKNLQTLVYFANRGGLVLIDSENIVEIIEPERK